MFVLLGRLTPILYPNSLHVNGNFEWSGHNKSKNPQKFPKILPGTLGKEIIDLTSSESKASDPKTETQIKPSKFIIDSITYTLLRKLFYGRARYKNHG